MLHHLAHRAGANSSYKSRKTLSVFESTKQPLLSNQFAARSYSSAVPKEFYQTLHKIVDHNKVGQVAEASAVYENLVQGKHSSHMATQHYNKIISSFAPRKIMWKEFVEHQDINEMYYRIGHFRPHERIEEAKIVFNDMKRVGVAPDVVTMNALMKVFLTCGETGIQESFDTLATMSSEEVRPNLASLATMMRGLSILGASEDALLVYNGALSIKDQSSLLPAVDDNNVFIHNLLLDTLAEAKDERIDSIYNSVVDRGIANGGTFTAYIKSLILRDLKQHLPEVAEVMRVNGVLQKELTKPARQQLYESYRKSIFPSSKWSYLHRTKMQQVINDDVPDHFLPVRRILMATMTASKGKKKDKDAKEPGEGESEGEGREE